MHGIGLFIYIFSIIGLDSRCTLATLAYIAQGLKTIKSDASLYIVEYQRGLSRDTRGTVTI
jgi:hypothetical protein